MSNLEDALGEAQEWTADFSATSDEFEALPEGWYPTTVVKAKPDKSQSGNPVVKLSYKVNEDHEAAGRYAFSSLNTDGKAAWKLRKVLKNLGVAAEGKSLKLSEKLFVDRQVYVYVDSEGWVTDWKPLETAATGGGLE